MKLFTFVIVALMISGVAMAAEVPTDAGDKAMVFMFYGLDHLDLGGYGDMSYSFGMRYYIADGTALRGGVVLGMDNYTDEVADMETTYNTYGLELVYEKHMEAPCASISPFWGLGGQFLTYSDTLKDNVTDDELTFSGTGFGAFGVCGFEWGFTDCMTLGGEYRLGFSSGSGEAELNGDSADLFSSTTTGFSATSVFLSVYW